MRVWIGITETPYGPMMIQLAPPPPYRDYQMNRVIGRVIARNIPGGVGSVHGPETLNECRDACDQNVTVGTSTATD